MNIPRKVSNCIVFYNVENGNLDFKAWSDYALSLMQSLKLKANYISVSGKGYPQDIVPASKAEKKILSKNYAGIEELTYIVTRESSDAPTYDWYVYLGLNTTLKGHELLICIDESIIDFSSEKFVQIIREASKTAEFKYGISYRREFVKGPEFYAMGSCMGIELKSIECEKIGDWNRDRLNTNRIKDGFLRDIYPYNILNDRHLSTQVGEGYKLVEWINELPAERGELEKVTKDLTLWRLPNVDAKIRQFLSPILISYHPEVKPSLS